MRKALFWGGIFLAMLCLTACTSKGEVDSPATIEALNATISAQKHHVATLEELAKQPSATLPPSSPTTALHRPTVMLSTPKPATSFQRPPTATPSPSPSASPTATATQTPIPDAAVGETLTNLRSGPAVGFGILSEVGPGAPLTILGKSADSEWLQVRIPDGTEGWMFYLPVELYIPIETIPITG